MYVTKVILICGDMASLVYFEHLINWNRVLALYIYSVNLNCTTVALDTIL